MIAGSPVLDMPPPQPNAWVQTLNDNLPNSGVDDNLTAGLTGGARYEHAVLGVSYELLTDKSIHMRSDDLRMTLGYQDTVAGIMFTIAGGFTDDGDYGGATVQNRFHHLIHSRQLHMHYAPDRTAALLIADIETVRQQGNIGYWPKLIFSVDSRGKCEYEGRLAAVLQPVHQHYAAWAGFAYRGVIGSEPNRITWHVDSMLDGPMLATGLQAHFVTFAIYAGEHAGFGSVGLAF